MRDKIRYVAVIVCVVFILGIPFIKQPFLAGESPISYYNTNIKKGGKK